MTISVDHYSSVISSNAVNQKEEKILILSSEIIRRFFLVQLNYETKNKKVQAREFTLQNI